MSVTLQPTATQMRTLRHLADGPTIVTTRATADIYAGLAEAGFVRWRPAPDNSCGFGVATMLRAGERALAEWIKRGGK